MSPSFNIILNINLRLHILRANREQSTSLLVGIGLRSANTISGSIRGRVGFMLELLELMPYLTFKIIFHLIKNMRLLNVFFYQNQFMNECARKEKAKIPESPTFLVSQFHSFFVRCRKTYVLHKPKNDTRKFYIKCSTNNYSQIFEIFFQNCTKFEKSFIF